MARREDRLKALADELAAAHRVRAEVIATDLTDAHSRGELPGQVAQRGLVVDILVNNAGFTTMGPVHRAERSAELAMVRTDVEAVVDLCTLFVPGDGHPAPGCRPEYRFHRGLPAASRSGRVTARRRPSSCPTAEPSVPSSGTPA